MLSQGTFNMSIFILDAAQVLDVYSSDMMHCCQGLSCRGCSLPDLEFQGYGLKRKSCLEVVVGAGHCNYLHMGGTG
jgi:hypothetical protein